MQIKTDDVILDDDIYPRANKQPKKIDEYAEAIISGVSFPAIEVQRIKDNGVTKLILLDGYHRLEAHKKLLGEPQLFSESNLPDLSKIEARCWNEDTLDKDEWLNRLRIRAIKLNKHGLPITRKDMEAIAQKIAKDDPGQKISSAEIAKEWDVTDRTVRNWTQGIRAQQTASRDQLIYKLSLLGWTQEEIAAQVGIKQHRVSQIINNGNFSKIDSSLHDWISKGKTIEEAASKLEIDATLGWALFLRDKTDNERLEGLDSKIEGVDAKPRPYDVWGFAKCLGVAGQDYAGRIPGQIVLNTLYFFTQQGELIIDPMAGGGTTLDVCLLMNRKCKAYDIASSRRDILSRNITELTEFGKKADLIFLDPPYFKKKAEEYNLPEEYYTKDGFLEFAASWVKFCNEALKPNGKVALLISDYIDYDDTSQSIFSDEYAALFQAAGYLRMYKISCPLSTEQYAGHDVDRAKKEKFLLIRGRELYILKREGSSVG